MAIQISLNIRYIKFSASYCTYFVSLNCGTVQAVLVVRKFYLRLFLLAMGKGGIAALPDAEFYSLSK